jgi:hypothetical protein
VPSLPTLLRVAWLAIGLGLGAELLFVALMALSGTTIAVAPVLADLVQKVSWSMLVCGGLALGALVGGPRPGPLGIAGLFASPLAFAVARALHRGISATIGLPLPGGPSPWTLATVKAVEYGVLGLLAGWLATRGRGAGAYIAAGAVVGLVFGGFVLGLSLTPPVAPAVLVPRLVNELVLPVGCVLTLFAAGCLAPRAR